MSDQAKTSPPDHAGVQAPPEGLLEQGHKARGRAAPVTVEVTATLAAVMPDETLAELGERWPSTLRVRGGSRQKGLQP